MIENKQEKIDKIYKEIANKELRFGCKVLIENRISLIIWENANWKYAVRYTWSWRIVSQQRELKEIIKIYWHPVMLGDVIHWIHSKYEWDFTMHTGLSKKELALNKIMYLWGDYRKPIEEDSEEIIDYIYNLLQNEQN